MLDRREVNMMKNISFFIKKLARIIISFVFVAIITISFIIPLNIAMAQEELIGQENKASTPINSTQVLPVKIEASDTSSNFFEDEPYGFDEELKDAITYLGNKINDAKNFGMTSEPEAAEQVLAVAKAIHEKKDNRFLTHEEKEKLIADIYDAFEALANAYEVKVADPERVGEDRVTTDRVMTSGRATNGKAIYELELNAVNSRNQQIGGALVAGSSQPELAAAKNTVFVEKIINQEKHSIDWYVDFYPRRENNDSPYYHVHFGLVLPSCKNKELPVHIKYDGSRRRNEETIDVYDPSLFPTPNSLYGLGAATGAYYRQGYDIGSQEFESIFEPVIRSFFAEKNPIPSPSPGSDINFWRDKGYLDRLITLREKDYFDREKGSVHFSFTTFHDENIDLSRVPLIAFFTGANYNDYRRIKVVGPFGIAAYQEIIKPNDNIYVDDINNLTSKDKSKIKDTIFNSTKEYYENQPESEEIMRRKKELGDAFNGFGQGNINVDDQGNFSITYRDGSKLDLEASKFLRQRELSVTPESQYLLQGNPVDITVSVNDPFFDGKNIIVPTKDMLPDGLKWDPASKKITGIPKIDWSEIQGTSGSKEKAITFDVALKTEDGAVNELLETKKTVNITVKQDPNQVPVGVHDSGNETSYIMIAIGIIAMALVLTGIAKRKDEIC